MFEKALSDDSELVYALVTMMKQCQDKKVSTVDSSPLLTAISPLAPHLVSTDGWQTEQDAAEFLLWILDTVHSQYKAKQCPSEDSLHNKQHTVEKLLSEKQVLVAKMEEAQSAIISSYRDALSRLAQVDRQLLKLTDFSPIYDLCCGQLVEARECQKCRKISVNLESYTVLPLPVFNNEGGNVVYQLADCFSHFSEVEELTRSSNMLHCSCAFQHLASSANGHQVISGLTPGKRLALLSYLPQKLIIQLTRFSYDAVLGSALKNQSFVEFPMPYEQKRTQLYDLSAFCVHSGARSASFGHYLAYCNVGRSWYCFNDRSVSAVHDIYKEISSSFVLRNAYILFYSMRVSL